MAAGQPRPLSFLEYYDLKARSFAWKDRNGQGAGNPLGVWGYVFVLLGAAGFIGGGLIAPAILYAAPYCDRCQRYMKRKTLAVLPAAVPEKNASKSDTAAQEAHAREQEAAAARADLAVARLREAISSGDVDSFRLELSAAGSAKANHNLPRRVEVAVTWCRSCLNGHIALTLVSGFGEQISQLKLEETAAHSEFIRGIVTG